MNPEHFMKIILSPVVTEKSSRMGAYSQFAFKVAKNADKFEIKAAIEHLFKVAVKSVNIVNVKPKRRRFRYQQGVRSGWKKAYITLEEGHSIDLAA